MRGDDSRVDGWKVSNADEASDGDSDDTVASAAWWSFRVGELISCSECHVDESSQPGDHHDGGRRSLGGSGAEPSSQQILNLLPRGRV